MSWHTSLRPVLWAFIAIGAISIAQADEPKPTISVSGSAEIRIVPDHVILTAAVETRAKEVATACKENQASIQRIVEFLKSSGVEDKHISTEYIAIEPIMRRPVYPNAKGIQQAQLAEDPFDRPDQDAIETPVHYLASRQFAITITDLAKFEIFIAVWSSAASTESAGSSSARRICANIATKRD